MASAQGSVLSSDYGLYAYTEYNITSTDTQVTLTVTKAVVKTSKSSIGLNSISGTYSGDGQTTLSVSGKQMRNSAAVTMFEGFTWTWDKGHDSSIKTISFSITHNSTSTATFTVEVPALVSYTITYNGNGSTGGTAPSSQTKYFNEALTLRTNSYTKTGYNFSKWNTNSGGTGTNYNNGASYTTNAAAILHAQWTAQTYTISFHANGGTAGTTTSLTRTYGTSFTIPATAIPTRNSYNFLGWSASSTATTPTYTHTNITSGTCTISAYNSDSTGPDTLYAVWKQAASQPTISQLQVIRVQDASSTTETNEGRYLRISFTYTSGKLNSSSSYATPTCTIEIDTIKKLDDVSITAGANKTYTVTYGTYSTDSQHTIKVTLTDDYGTATKTTTVSTSIYPIDLVGNGTNVYMGIMTPAKSGQILTLPDGVKVSGDITATSLNGITIPTSLSFTDTKVTVSAVTPSTSTNYYPVFRTPTAGQNVGLPTSETIDLKANAYIRFQILQGTTSAEGKSQILLGNGNATGTNANSKGYITMYTASTGYTTLGCANHTGSVSITFPAQTGTVALTSQLHSHNYYSGAWAATSSAATNVQLTEILTLPAGTYLIVVNSPYVNTANLTVALSINNTTNVNTTVTFRSGAYTQSANIVQLTAQSTVKAISQSSTSVSLTYTERGGIKAVRLCD